MKLYFYIFIFVSILLNIYLFSKITIVKSGISKVTDVLKSNRSGDFNRRLHMGKRDKSLEELSTELNMLMDSFNDIIDKKQHLEKTHKQLISNISHDIRTPLTSLLGYVEVLRKEKGISAEEKEKYLEIIESKGQLLYRLIQEFFQLSKLESEDTPLRFEKHNLAEKVRDVAASFYHDIVKAQVIPEIQVPEEPVYVWGDGTSMERILQNLISNALKYGKDGGVIGIKLRQEQKKVWVDVWDCGQGIPEKDIKYIFDRLYTAEPSRNEGLRGSGLGLAITKKLIEKQGGEIFASSMPGERTVFSFYIIKSE